MKAENRIVRTRAFLAAEGLDAVVVRSTSDLMWLTGFSGVFDSEEAHTALLTAERAVIHTDSRYSAAMRAAALEEGIWDVDDSRSDGMAFAAEAARDAGCARGRIAIDAMTPLALYRKLAQALPDAELVERSADILSLRSVKEPAEIECMRRAQAIASAAFVATLERLHAGMSETQVSLELEMQMRSRGADELAFANIVASGPNSANPHAIPSGRIIERGDLVVFDFGARVDGYRSDTTRTVSIGEPTEQQRRIYAAVRQANERVRSRIRPGVTGAEMHGLAEEVLAEHGFAGRMGHGLGHGVGLDIHESPVLSPRNGKPLAAGSVVTVEPGVYLTGSDGVRIEDCGVVCDDGYMNFCDLSHDLQVVE